MTSDFTLKQKVQIMKAYTEVLNVKASFGIQPTTEEIQLLREGAEDINDDITEVMRAILPVAKKYIQHQHSVLAEFVPKMAGDVGDER